MSVLWLVMAVLAESISLPGGSPVAMDYAAFDAVEGRLWIPAGNTGNVDVITTLQGKPVVTALSGFATRPSPRANRPRMGPSSVTIAGKTVWIGNRGDDQLCSFAAASLKKGRCVAVPSMPDGLAYVARTDEVWVTTPRARAITIVDAKEKPTTAVAATIPLDGSPEGYAVDQVRGIFYTNLEDRDVTLAIDVTTRKILATASPGCGEEGPRGLALDGARRQLFVACTHGVVSLDVAAAGSVIAPVIGRLQTGGGVDNIDYDPRTRMLYVASGEDGMLTFARVDGRGALARVGKVATAPGARNAVIDARGIAYVPDANGGRLIVIKPPRP